MAEVDWEKKYAGQDWGPRTLVTLHAPGPGH